ncbi:MAG: FAD-dependent oxidoreductase [Chthoniobacteraceae bacterium]
MKTRSLPCNDGGELWDVIVVGGGPAGCAAAIAAAREGARTLLLESTGALGGNGTGGLVPTWCPFSDKEKIIYRGLAEEVLNRCKAGEPHVDPKTLDWVPIDAELLKRIYDDLATEAGVHLLFQTSLAAVVREADGGLTLIVNNKAGLTALRAKVYIDGTGDADLCAGAGAEFHKGDDGGELMPATHCFILGNVDEYAYRTLYGGGWVLHPNNPGSPIYQILASGKYPLITDAHFCTTLVGPGLVGFNAGHLWEVDNTDPESVSRALVLGRAMAAQIRDALAEFCPRAFANAFLVETAGMMGIRESRRVVGDYVLSFDDYMERRSFKDEICRNAYYIDVHAAKAQAARDTQGSESHETRTFRYGPGESHGLPYRCLLPRGLRNVLVVGRSISCERIVQGSVRVMPVCLAMGEAAGIAAQRAASEHGGEVRAVDVAALRTRLRARGAYLP